MSGARGRNTEHAQAETEDVSVGRYTGCRWIFNRFTCDDHAAGEPARLSLSWCDNLPSTAWGMSDYFQDSWISMLSRDSTSIIW